MLASTEKRDIAFFVFICAKKWQNQSSNLLTLRKGRTWVETDSYRIKTQTQFTACSEMKLIEPEEPDRES